MEVGRKGLESSGSHHRYGGWRRKIEQMPLTKSIEPAYRRLGDRMVAGIDSCKRIKASQDSIDKIGSNDGR